jgi:hypothetical protein
MPRVRAFEVSMVSAGGIFPAVGPFFTPEHANTRIEKRIVTTLTLQLRFYELRDFLVRIEIKLRGWMLYLY